MKISSIGVIGAGQMGSGIAHVCALAGLNVGLNDISPERIAAGIDAISGNIGRQVKSGKVTEEQRWLQWRASLQSEFRRIWQP